MLQALPKPGDLGPVEHPVQVSVGGSFGEVELDRVRAAVDDGEALGRIGHDVRKRGDVAAVDIRAQTDVAHGGDDLDRIGVLDRDRPSLVAVRVDVAALRRAAADRVAHPALLHRDGLHAGLRRAEDGQQIVERGGPVRCVGRGLPQRGGGRGDVIGGEGELRLQDGEPLLEAIGIDLAQGLDVEQAGSQLHDLGAGRDDVRLFALLDTG